MKQNFYLVAIILSVVFSFNSALAHCDGIDGPVVKAAQKSIEENNVNYVLAWIQPQYEQEVKTVFSEVMNVRSLNEEVMKISDNYFFETVVHLHRLGEGEPYTGLKPAGTKISEAVVQADQSLENNDLPKIESLLTDTVKESIEEKFYAVFEMSKYNPDDLVAAREYVEAYVQYIHYAEKVFEISGSHQEHQAH